MHVALPRLPRLLLLALACAATTPAMAQTPAAPTGDLPRKPAVADFKTCAKPEWPKDSLRNREEGTVTLRFLIGVDGSVKESVVVKSSGFPKLDRAAQLGIGRCQFKPGTNDGQETQAWMQMQYVWTLTPQPSQKELAAVYESVRWIAEGGDADAQYKLGMLLEAGRGVARDVDAAKVQLLKAAGQGHALAQDRLGMFAAAGFGGKADMAEAMAWYRKAAEQGLAQSQTMLGNMLMNPKNPGYDAALSQAWLRKAAAQGNALALSGLGRKLWNEAGAQGDVSEALALLEKAAAKGDRTAQFYVGRAYESGRGVAQDYVKAAQWYQSAVTEGDANAHRALARLYEAGEGVAQNQATADALKQRAALLSR